MSHKSSVPYMINLMALEDAKSIVKWRYEPLYSMYNMSDDEEDIQELMDGSYYSVKNPKSELIGFFCFGKNAQVGAGAKQGMYMDQNALDIGLGLRPDLTGQGIGREFLIAGMDFAQKQFTLQKFRLSVAAFNQRAVSLYERVGFVPKGDFIRELNEDETKFIVMEYLLDKMDVGVLTEQK